MSQLNSKDTYRSSNLHGARILILCSLLTIATMLYMTRMINVEETKNTGSLMLQTQTETPISIYYRSGDPIINSSVAISMTLTELPGGFEAVTPEARLVDYQTYRQTWLQEGIGQEEIDPSVPVWIVGALKAGLTVGDTINIPGIGYGAVSDNRPAEGAYVAWHANEGSPLSAGALMQGAPASYASLVALPTQPLIIMRPTVPIGDP